MHSFAAIFVLLILFAAVAAVTAFLRVLVAGSKKAGAESVPDQSDYESVALLSPAERSFFGVLHQAVALEYQIFAKVRVADIIHPARGQSRSSWQKAFNRITGKHVDFVLCERGSLQVLAAIELDDSTHSTLERGVRDGLIDSALANAHIPVLRIPARESYSPAQIRMYVEGLLSTQKAQPAPSGANARDRARDQVEAVKRVREQRPEPLPDGRASVV
jgi:hypothetical protein